MYICIIKCEVMAVNYFKRYIWLIDLIARRGYISFKEISEAWRKSPLNETGSPLSERTFFNHKGSIEEMFDIEIKNDRSLGFYIRNNNFEKDSTSNWMLNALCMNNLLQENSDMKDRILLEEIPSSQRFLPEVISAMRSGRVISLTYQSFNNPEAHAFPIKPYCVKLFKQRWYVLAESELGLRMYALDRFVDMEELDQSFTLPEEFDIESYFHSYFGVIVGDEPEEIKIKTTPNKAYYLRTLPLHRSQKEAVQEDGSSIFNYYLAPSYDFIQELLSHGDEIEVLAPDTLRDNMSSIIATMASHYANSHK